MKYIDLFGGIGGFRLGIEKVTNGEWECVWYNDIDKYAVNVYNRRFNENYEARDIRNVDEGEIPRHDCICAGFPCQSFSIAGKRRGLEDTRGTLFFEICRVAQHHKPKLLFLENVRGLLSHDEGNTFKTILKSLWELGYDVEWQVLNSKDFGVPQNRERVFIIGHLGGFGGRQIFPIGNGNKSFAELQRLKVGAITSRRGNAKSDGDYIVESFGATLQEEDSISVTAHCLRGGARQRYDTETCIAIADGGQSYRVYSSSGISPTITTPSGGHHLPKIECHPCLTPDRLEKRQHGRRFKEDGVEMFTLTGQDVHGVELRYVLGDGRPNRSCLKSGRTAELIEKISPGIRAEHHNTADVHFIPDIANTVDQDGYLRFGERPHVENGKPQLLPIGYRRIRRPTPIECERLQGFPDGWTECESDTQRYKMLGNAVTVNVIEAIAKRLRERYC